MIVVIVLLVLVWSPFSISLHNARLDLEMLALVKALHFVVRR